MDNIKKSVKKANENWVGEQCSEIEENPRKNNSKRAYQIETDLTTVKQGKATTIQECPRGMIYRRTACTEPIDRVLL